MPVFKPVIVTTIVPTHEEAEKIGGLFLGKHLTTRVQYETITSQYLWNGEICRDDEIRIIIKTSRHCYREIQRTIIASHSYDCPQIPTQNVSRGFIPYPHWLKQCLGLKQPCGPMPSKNRRSIVMNLQGSPP